MVACYLDWTTDGTRSCLCYTNSFARSEEALLLLRREELLHLSKKERYPDTSVISHEITTMMMKEKKEEGIASKSKRASIATKACSSR